MTRLNGERTRSPSRRKPRNQSTGSTPANTAARTTGPPRTGHSIIDDPTPRPHDEPGAGVFSAWLVWLRQHPQEPVQVRVPRVREGDMNKVRKKRGWVYRGVLIIVSVLAIAVGGLLIVSTVVSFDARYPTSHNSYRIIFLGYGSVYINEYYNIYPEVPSFHIRRYGQGQSAWPIRWSFEWNNDPGLRQRIAFPLWFPFVVLVTWPAIAFIRWFTAKPLTGHCPACNYDLRGSKGSITCPECGEAIARACGENCRGLNLSLQPVLP